MATRSFISHYDNKTETYESIYCHWDGYPQGVGVTLRDHYDSDRRVHALIAIGDISCLRNLQSVTEKEAYKLRGDTDVDAKLFRFRSEMIEYYRNMSCEYGYIWRDGKWQCLALDPQEIDLSTMESFTNV
jgi:hypothetical protein